MMTNFEPQCKDVSVFFSLRRCRKYILVSRWRNLRLLEYSLWLELLFVVCITKLFFFCNGTKVIRIFPDLFWWKKQALFRNSEFQRKLQSVGHVKYSSKVDEFVCIWQILTILEEIRILFFGPKILCLY